MIPKKLKWLTNTIKSSGLLLSKAKRALLREGLGPLVAESDLRLSNQAKYRFLSITKRGRWEIKFIHNRHKVAMRSSITSSYWVLLSTNKKRKVVCLLQDHHSQHKLLVVAVPQRKHLKLIINNWHNLLKI